MYEQLKIDFEIPEELQRSIDQLMEYLNTSKNPGMDDCERTEVLMDLNWCYRENLLTSEQIDLLKKYYVRGGIHEGKNDNWV